MVPDFLSIQDRLQARLDKFRKAHGLDDHYRFLIRRIYPSEYIIRWLESTIGTLKILERNTWMFSPVARRISKALFTALIRWAPWKLTYRIVAGSFRYRCLSSLIHLPAKPRTCYALAYIGQAPRNEPWWYRFPGAIDYHQLLNLRYSYYRMLGDLVDLKRDWMRLETDFWDELSECISPLGWYQAQAVGEVPVVDIAKQFWQTTYPGRRFLHEMEEDIDRHTKNYKELAELLPKLAKVAVKNGVVLNDPGGIYVDGGMYTYDD